MGLVGRSPNLRREVPIPDTQGDFRPACPQFAWNASLLLLSSSVFVLSKARVKWNLYTILLPKNDSMALFWTQDAGESFPGQL